MITSTFRRVHLRRTGFSAALVALAVVVAACNEKTSSTGSAGTSSGAAPAQSQAGFNLGGVYQVNLHYGNFTFGPECPPAARNSQPFDVSYRASAQGSTVTLKNLGQGFDMTGTGQSDGTLSLSGGMDLAPGVRQSGTLKGRWSPQQLDFEAGILFEMTPPQGAKQTCSVKAKATGSATRTT